MSTRESSLESDVPSQLKTDSATKNVINQQRLNGRIAAGAGISPDDLMIQLSEQPGENFSFGQD